jgi:hypothetical protein
MTVHAGTAVPLTPEKSILYIHARREDVRQRRHGSAGAGEFANPARIGWWQ